jgi:uncharacterized protein (TIGR00369 family)
VAGTVHGDADALPSLNIPDTDCLWGVAPGARIKFLGLARWDMTDLSETFIENRYRVLPNHANNHGTVHGGNVMKWMDEIGALSAMRHAGNTVVTASIDQLDFLQPVPVGDTVVIRSFVYDAGQSSMHVRLEAARENPESGESEPTTESTFVYVAVDEDGAPVEVPGVTVDGERGERLREAALDGGRIEEAVRE